MKLKQNDKWTLASLMHDLICGGPRKRNTRVGLALARLLAELGEPIAFRYLAHAYDRGIGVRQDKKLAFIYWSKAAGSGDAPSEAALGYAYAKGEGVGKNLLTAVRWEKRAARAGSADAQYNLGQAYAEGEGARKNPRLAFKWLLKAANRGHAEAQCNVAVAYENGDGVLKNIKSAMRWYQRATRSGDKLARENLARLRRTLRINPASSHPEKREHAAIAAVTRNVAPSS